MIVSKHTLLKLLKKLNFTLSEVSIMTSQFKGFKQLYSISKLLRAVSLLQQVFEEIQGV